MSENKVNFGKYKDQNLTFDQLYQQDKSYVDDLKSEFHNLSKFMLYSKSKDREEKLKQKSEPKQKKKTKNEDNLEKEIAELDKKALAAGLSESDISIMKKVAREAIAKLDKEIVEQPKVEEPKVEQPKVEQPKEVKQPKSRGRPTRIRFEDLQPVVTKVEESKVEVIKVEEPKVGELKVEEPKVEEPKVEQPKVEEPKVEQPKVESAKERIERLKKLREGRQKQLSRKA